MIPKIIRNYINYSKNLLVNVFNDKIYYEYTNIFKLKKLKIGPVSERQYLHLKLINLRNQVRFDSSDKYEKINFKYSIKEQYEKGKLVNYSIFVNIGIYFRSLPTIFL